MATFTPKTLDFTNPVAPNLPLAPTEYERQFQDQFENILRLYFNQLDNAFGSLLGPTGGKYLKFPYGAFSSSQNQSTTANTATLMTLNTTDFSNGVSISSSKITVANSGIYNLQFSTQFQNTDNAQHDISIWLKQGNDGGAATDIAGSTGFISIPARKSAGAGNEGHGIFGWNYFLSMNVNDYIQIYWSTTNAAVTIEYYAASTGPVRPSTQSVVATLSFVSRLPT
jgi:hypothetical protein